MTETNMGFANSGSDDDIDGLEFRVDGDDSLEHDLSELRQEYDDVMSSDTSEEEGNDEEPEEYDEGPAEYEPTEINQAIASPVQNSDTIIIAKSKVVLIEKLLQNIRENNDKIIQLLSGSISPEDEARISISQVGDEKFVANKTEDDGDSRIIEGVFDGENMIGPDGKQYSMPANYASKSKLVEGDIMKLTITEKGTFVYKQIGPIERRRVVGIIVQSEGGNFYVVDEGGRKWRVLTASITYYKGQVGDEAVILIPKDSDSKWAAVDNVVRRQE